VTANQTATQTVSVASVQAGTVAATLRLNTGVTLPGTATLAQFKAQLTPTGGTAVVKDFTDANADGTFEATFPGLAAGNYALTIVAPTGVAATYGTTTLPVPVTLAAGATATQAFVITAATATATP
jgi:hypothetical protein